jgi:hypothetical protein
MTDRWSLGADERRLVVWALQCLLLTTVDAAHTRDDLRRAAALLNRLNEPIPVAWLGVDRYLPEAEGDG